MKDPSVLVVDDDDDLRTLVTMVLEDAGFHTESAANGREALVAVRKRMPNVIVLDMRMPIMDGWQFCRALDEEGLSRPRILVATAAPDAAARAAEVGADGCVSKPFSLDRLISEVNQLLPAPSQQQ